jgi:hypothetical protein
MVLVRVELHRDEDGSYTVFLRGVANDGNPMGTAANGISVAGLGDHLRKAAGDLETMETVWTAKKEARYALQQENRSGRIKVTSRGKQP